MKALAENLKQLMQKKRWNVSETARAAKCSPSQVWKLLNGEHSPTLRIVDRLAEAFGKESWQLLKPSSKKKK